MDPRDVNRINYNNYYVGQNLDFLVRSKMRSESLSTPLKNTPPFYDAEVSSKMSLLGKRGYIDPGYIYGFEDSNQSENNQYDPNYYNRMPNEEFSNPNLPREQYNQVNSPKEQYNNKNLNNYEMNNNPNNNYHNYYKERNLNDNMNNNGNNNINKNNESNYRNKNYYNISLNQSGIGPSKTIIGVNSPQQQSLNDSKKEEYEKLAKKKNDLLDLMNKMQFDKFLVKDNSNTNDNENNNNGFNHNEENKNNNKDILEPEKENTLKNIPSITDTNKNKINANKFDDRLLESQAFEPEKLAKLAMDEIPNPGIDDFNFGQEPLNPYEEDDNDNNKKKSDLNFGFNSPIDNKHFNFDKNNISLASEIKKIDDDNGYPNIEQENLGNNISFYSSQYKFYINNYLFFLFLVLNFF